jgi:hypothetical protein
VGGAEGCRDVDRVRGRVRGARRRRRGGFVVAPFFVS